MIGEKITVFLEEIQYTKKNNKLFYAEVQEDTHYHRQAKGMQQTNFVSDTKMALGLLKQKCTQKTENIGYD